MTQLVALIDQLPRITREHLTQFVCARMNADQVHNGEAIGTPAADHRLYFEPTENQSPIEQCHILVTGSLYLVGCALKVSLLRAVVHLDFVTHAHL